MRAGAAKKKAADGRFVTRPIQNGTHGKKLIESEFAVKNVAAGEAVGSFEIKRRDDLHVFDETGQIRRVSGQGFDNGAAQVVAARVPVPFFQLEWGELDVGGQDVIAVGGERGIENCRNGDIEPRGFREFAVLGGIKGALEVVDFGADVDAAGEGFEKALRRVQRSESRQTGEGEIDLGDGAIGAEIFHAVGKGGVELRGIDELEKGAFGIDAGDDGFDSDFFAIGENDAGDGAVFDENVADFGIGADFSAGLFRGFGESAREGTESAARKRGRAYGMDIGGGAQKKDGGLSGRPGTKRGAKNAARGDDGAKEFGFEKFSDEIRDGHGTPAEQIEDAGLSKASNAAAGLEKAPEIFGSRLVDRGRRDGRELGEETGGFFES